MVKIIRNWCEGIIVAIILSIIIEILVPDGNNKKYVKVVIGVYIIFVVINPILKLMDYDFNFDFFKYSAQEETYVNINTDMKDVYIVGIEQELKKEIENLGYSVKTLKVNVDKSYENIESIEIKIENKTDKNMIEPVVIGDNKIKENFEEVTNYIKENYNLNEEQIIINN